MKFYVIPQNKIFLFNLDKNISIKILELKGMMGFENLCRQLV